MRYGRQVVSIPGTGELRYLGFVGEVDYQLAGDSNALTARSVPLRGSFTAEPDVAAAAFKARDGYPKLQDGKTCRLTMLGYADGSDTAYFEIRL